MNPTALIAEDEPLLAAALQQMLAQAWPGLEVQACVGDGHAAVQQALALRPEVVFLDIRMPGQDGLQAAAELAECWPLAETPFPELVFVTAYDQYAIQAFEAQAMDYLLKPVQLDRLHKTVARLQARRAARQAAPAALESTLEQLRGLLGRGQQASGGPARRLSVLQASQGQDIHLVAVDKLLYLEAADKYVRACTEAQAYWVRTPLKELYEQLDPEAFWQVHRGTVVRVAAIAKVVRDEQGRLWLHLHGRPERLAVSRLHAQRFKAM